MSEKTYTAEFSEIMLLKGLSEQELAQCSPVLTISFAAPLLPSSPSPKLNSGKEG